MSTNPTPQQQQAIEHSPSPLMIFAGAGTGKTFTLVERIVYLIETQSIDPHHILMITYTERAARELREKVVSKAGPIAEKMTVGTFHSICYQIVKDFGADSPPPRLLDESEAIYILLNAFDELGPFESADFALEPEKAVLNNFLPFFNRCSDELIDPTSLPDPELDSEKSVQINDLKRVHTLYQQLKRKANVVDYGDMIVLAHNLLESDRQILKSCRDRFRHIIVDEFQDNNFALNEVVRLIARNRQSVTVVGDDDQVIYSFRGASAYNIKVFRDTYSSHRKFLTMPLEINFRSHQQILDVANDIIRHNEDRQVKLLKAYVERQGPLPTLFWAERKDQPAIIVEQIKKLLSEGFAFSDMAVLCRTRNQAEELSKTLLSANIHVEAEFRRFFEIKEIRTLVAWCQVVGGGKHAEVALYRLIRDASGEEQTYDIFSRFKRKDTTPKMELLQSLNGALPESVRNLLDLAKKLKALTKKRNAGEMIWEICEQTGLLRPLVKRHSYDDQIALINVGNLIKQAQEFHKDENERGLRRFNVYLDSMMTAGNWQAEVPPSTPGNSAVRLQTIHAAKGGEFPVVFIPFNRSGSFPLSFRKSKMVDRPLDEWMRYAKDSHLTDRDHHLQEERRLIYVAITRAKERLFLLAPKKAASPFIKELDKTLVKEFDYQTEIEV
ncbi:MAG: ATP-dependent helicase [Candidatus Neomarinimicrobiota bacterium]|nr:ATP-dependent helicase [Candidatus Neomarinimicrobiota bacterium]